MILALLNMNNQAHIRKFIETDIHDITVVPWTVISYGWGQGSEIMPLSPNNLLIDSTYIKLEGVECLAPTQRGSKGEIELVMFNFCL